MPRRGAIPTIGSASMSAWSVSDVTQGIAGTLRRAASATGAGFDYLVKTAMRESSMDPSAKAKSSSAAGMFQFVEQTWLQMVKEAGPKHGLGKEAAAITRSANGRYSVADPKMRQQILDLRYDTETAALMAGEFTEKNSAQMTAALRRPPSEGELYAAHFLGAQGAIDLIRLAGAAPDARAASYFPEAASANRSIFYSHGRARGAADVLATLVGRHDRTSVPETMTASAPFAAQGAAGLFSDTDPSLPVLAYADDRPVFHSMFQTARRPPVSSYVHGIWAGLAPASATGVGRVVPARSDAGSLEPLDLSGFMKPGVAWEAKDS